MLFVVSLLFVNFIKVKKRVNLIHFYFVFNSNYQIYLGIFPKKIVKIWTNEWTIFKITVK